jgi:hypothetical protein
MKMKLNHVLSKGLITLALLSSISLLSVMPAKAAAFTYDVVGPVAGTFNADISSTSNAFNTWSLTPFTFHTFVPADAGTNFNLGLSQTFGSESLSFLITSPTTWAGTYVSSGTSAVIHGDFSQQVVSTPEAGTYLLLLAGLGIVGLATRYRMFA